MRAGVDQPLGDHGIKGQPIHIEAAFAQHEHIIFQVLAHFGLARVAHHRAQRIQHLLHGQLGLAGAVPHGDVVALAGFDRQ